MDINFYVETASETFLMNLENYGYIGYCPYLGFDEKPAYYSWSPPDFTNCSVSNHTLVHVEGLQI
jgi:hypothetical protein